METKSALDEAVSQISKDVMDAEDLETATGEPSLGEPTAGEPTAGEPTAGEPAAGEPATVIPQTVPLAKYLEAIHRLKALTRGAVGQPLGIPQREDTRATTDKPVTIAQIREKYKLAKDDAFTVEMAEELETNRAERTAIDQRLSIEERRFAGEKAFEDNQPPELEVIGLGVSDVLTRENLELLNGRQWRTILNKPPEEQSKATYEILVSLHPELSKKFAAFNATKTTKSTTVKKAGTVTSPAKPPVKKPVLTQEQIIAGSTTPEEARKLATNQIFGPDEE